MASVISKKEPKKEAQDVRRKSRKNCVIKERSQHCIKVGLVKIPGLLLEAVTSHGAVHVTIFWEKQFM